MTTSDNDHNQRLARLEAHHTNVMSALLRIESRLDDSFVTHAEFWPVRTIVYVGAGTVLLSVLGAVIAIVVRVA